MYTANNASQRARWAVMWIAVKGRKRKVIRKDFDDDLPSARDLYLKAVAAGKPYVTLACVNMGFPPPSALRTREVRKKGRVKGSRKIKIVTVEINPLKELNAQGKLWCPYCMQLRPFALRKFMVVHGIAVREPRYVCPICGASSNDHNVRFWNPSAAIHMTSSLAAMQHKRRSRTTTRRRRS